MAMAARAFVHISSSLLMVCLLLPCSFAIPVGVDGLLVAADLDHFRPELVCSASPTSEEAAARRRPNTLQILHRRGPCYPHDGVGKPDRRQALARDLLRVNSINARLSGATGSNSSSTDQSTRRLILPLQSDAGEYAVALSLGTPGTEQMVEIDTGSDVCWIQCKPCSASCFPQQQPPFDPSASSSYSNVSCPSPTCRDFGGRCSPEGTCLYTFGYADGSVTNGVLATETLALTPSSSVFPNFLFGCGHDNRGTFWRETGLFGLGRNRHSLVSQTAGKLGGASTAFSYCLPSKSSATGYLTLGNVTATTRSAEPILYTPMLADPYFYFVDLIGISVGDRRLPVPPTVFRSSGTILDSGTMLGYLPRRAYAALRSAFRRAMSHYPRAQRRVGMDTCYDFSKTQTVFYPPITLHYVGANVTLGFVNVFDIDDDLSQVCLAFAANDMVGIIGNIQQRTFEVTYDIGRKKFGFSPGACS